MPNPQDASVFEEAMDPRADLVISGKSLGSAGIIEREGTLTIAIFSAAKLRLPCRGTLDGRAVNILRVLPDTDRNAASPRFFTLIAQYVDDPT